MAEKSAGHKTISLPAAGAIILFFFFCSGGLGLVYEVVWTRLLRHVMGNTVYSITTVLSAFMAGLALGGYLGGKLIDRRGDPLRVYAFLEGAVGIYCLFLPVLIAAAQPFYQVFYRQCGQQYYLFNFLRFVFSFLLLLPPAALMGATLPVLSKFFIHSAEKIGRTIGTLYALNTFGAVLGSFAAGFIFIPLLGVNRTIHSAALLNILICLGALLLSRRLPLRKKVPPRQSRPASSGEAAIPAVLPGTPVLSRLFPATVLIAYALSGFAALVYEIAWTRALMLIIGSSVYAFCLMLTAFIFGLALGGIVFSRFLHRWKDLVLVFAVFELAIGFSALLAVPVFGRLPLFMTGLIMKFGGSFWTLQLVEFGLIFALLLVPTVMMGAAFPLANRLYARGTEKIGGSVGAVYAANTLGSILGSSAGGFLLLPWLGIRKTILAAVLVNLGIGLLFLGISSSLSANRKRTFAAVAAVLAAALMSFLPGWDKAVMSSATYLYAPYFFQRASQMGSTMKKEIQETKILYHKEGISDTVTVTEDSQGLRSYRTNGKVDGSIGSDMLTQELLAHVPILLHPHPRSVLVIGLATGVTLGSAGRYPVERLDCVEISPSAREPYRFFLDANYDVLSDPRARLIIADGRNYLSLSGETYDVITSEPSNPWIAGVADLFTQEFFEILRKRLNPGGVACVWLHAYSFQDRDFRSVVRTFHGVFDHTTVWESFSSLDYLLLGSTEPFRINYENLRKRMADEKVASDLRRIDIGNPLEFCGCSIMGAEAIDQYAAGAPLHTDDNALLEFSAPRSLLKTSVDVSLLEGINRRRGQGLEFLTWEGTEKREAEALKLRLAEIIEAKKRFVSGDINLENQKCGAALRDFVEAAARDPGTVKLMKKQIDILFYYAFSRMTAGSTKESAEIFQGLLKLDPRNAQVHSHLGRAYGMMNRGEEAIAEGKIAIELDPRYAVGHYNLGVIYLGLAKFEEAVAASRAAIALDPGWAAPHHNLGMIYLNQGKFDDARAEFETSIRLDPAYSPGYTGLAHYYEKTGNLTEAEAWRRRAEESARR